MLVNLKRSCNVRGLLFSSNGNLLTEVSVVAAKYYHGQFGGSLESKYFQNKNGNCGCKNRVYFWVEGSHDFVQTRDTPFRAGCDEKHSRHPPKKHERLYRLPLIIEYPSTDLASLLGNVQSHDDSEPEYCPFDVFSSFLPEIDPIKKVATYATENYSVTFSTQHSNWRIPDNSIHVCFIRTDGIYDGTFELFVVPKETPDGIRLCLDPCTYFVLTPNFLEQLPKSIIFKDFGYKCTLYLIKKENCH